MQQLLHISTVECVQWGVHPTEEQLLHISIVCVNNTVEYVQWGVHPAEAATVAHQEGTHQIQGKERNIDHKIGRNEPIRECLSTAYLASYPRA